jgi:hypothetical protein
MGVGRRSPSPEPLLRAPPFGGPTRRLLSDDESWPLADRTRTRTRRALPTAPTGHRRRSRPCHTHARQESLAGSPRRCLDWRHDVPGATGPSRCPCLATRRACRRGGATPREPRRQRRGSGRGRSRLGRRDRAAGTARLGWRSCRHLVAGRSFASRVATARDLNLRVHYEAEAATEVLQAFQWYEARREGLGVEFLDEIDATIRRALPSAEPRSHDCIPTCPLAGAICGMRQSQMSINASPNRGVTKWVG